MGDQSIGNVRPGAAVYQVSGSNIVIGNDGRLRLKASSATAS